MGATNRHFPELRDIREAYGIKQDELADQLGVSRVTISNRETRGVVSEQIYQLHLQSCRRIQERKLKKLNP